MLVEIAFFPFLIYNIIELGSNKQLCVASFE